MKFYNKKYIKIPNGETVAYIESGETNNETIVLIHGNLASSGYYSKVIEKLEDKYRVICPDMRGYGDSSYIHEWSSLKEPASDICAFMDALNIKNVVVGGWSTGGGVAQLVAIARPDLVKKLLLIDSISCMGYPCYKKDENGRGILGATYESKEALLKDPTQVGISGKFIDTRDYDGMMGIWNKQIYTGILQPTEEESYYYVSETFKQRCIVDVFYANSHHNISHKKSFYEEGTGEIDKITCPVMILYGDNDRVVVKRMTDENLTNFPKYEEVVIQGSGHAPLIDNVEAFINSIIPFISK